MSTAVFEVARSIPLRIQELQRLATLAADTEKTDEASYNTLCRACCVLLAAHIEGFIKDLSKTLISDFNFNLKSFSKMPEAMKRTFCEKIAFYNGIEQSEIDQRIKQLTTYFSAQDISIDFDAFTYKENKNRNPGPDVIESAFNKIGVPSMLKSISANRFENIFKNDNGLSFDLRRDMKRHHCKLYKFPYQPLPKKYSFNHKSKSKGGDETTIWHEFIEGIMRRRHTIAHGDTLSNETNHQELHQDIEKIEILMHGILYSSTTYLCKSFYK